MALPQAVVRGTGGTIEVYAPVRPGGNPVVVVEDGNGGAVVPSTPATVDAVNTTLSVAAAAGAISLSVVGAGGIAAGFRYRLGPADPATGAEAHEFVTVRAVSGTTVSLAHPTLLAHVIATPFQGTRMSLAVTGAQAGYLFWDGRARWSWDAMAPLVPFETRVECVLRRIENLCTIEDVAAYDPVLVRRWLAAHSQGSPEAYIRRSFERVMNRIGARYRANTSIGSDALTEPTALMTRLRLVEDTGGDAETLARLNDEYVAAFADMLAVIKSDADQDGAVEDHESPPGLVVGRFLRA